MIDVDTAGDVAVVTMQAGENRFNADFVRSLQGALDEVTERRLPLVLTGSGKFFSNGLDLEWLTTAGSTAGGAMFSRLHGVLAKLLTFPAATAAAINGHAFGAGAMLAAAADSRVMREDRGFLCFPEVDLGLPMSPQFSALCRAKFPRSSLLRAWVSGDRYAAPEAIELGFVDDAAPEGAVLDRAVAMVRPLAGKDPATVQALKASLYADARALLTTGTS
jgi:Delta3-Delta2-enoyl-CoA isomerase